MKLKPLHEQTIVITGASSGIGLATARMAAQRGAKLVLVSRTGETLDEIIEDIREGGGTAICVEADVADEEQVRRVAEAAIQRFDGFDTWINNASTAIYGRAEEVSLEDARRLFDINFWGVVHGSLIALEHLKQHGGALINVGSVESDRALPLMSIYAASKHAVKGYTDALRMEVEKEGAPVSVTLIKPSSIDTPFRDHARNYMNERPQYPPPVYAPQVVARAILHCAEHPRARMMVGGGGRMIGTLGMLMPRLTDLLMEWLFFDLQRTGEPERRAQGTLQRGGNGGRETGGYKGRTRQHSLYTTASRHPLVTGAMVLGGAAAATGIFAMLRHHRDANQLDEVARQTRAMESAIW